MTDLAKRAVACEGWRWMPGMLPLDGTGFSNRILRVRDDGMPIDGHGALPDALPDLTDPCTVGGLLALVRVAWGDEHLHVGRRIAGWGVWTSASTPLPQCVGKGDTEAGALVVALEAGSL